jgi:hypothetical protein
MSKLKEKASSLTGAIDNQLNNWLTKGKESEISPYSRSVGYRTAELKNFRLVIKASGTTLKFPDWKR